MRNTQILQASPLQRASTWMRLSVVSASVAAAALFALAPADAASALCANGSKCMRTTTDAQSPGLQSLTGAQIASRNPLLSDQEYLSFSGVGAVVCTVNGAQRMSTAFLVGAFDLGVTVAHTFEQDGVWADPASCVYTTTDSLGQIRERIPVSSIKAQWETEDGAFGQPAKDFAVIRLSQPSRFAQRTMPLGKFSGAAATVLMIGFNASMDGDTVKHKTHGTVYERTANGVAISNMAGFTHDMDSHELASGAPVIDENTGVIIGIHTQWLTVSKRSSAARNTMITMNDWLERTLRLEMLAGKTAAVETASR